MTHFFDKIWRNNKKIFFKTKLFFIILVIGALFSPSLVEAGWVKNLANWIATRPLLLVIKLIHFVAKTLASLSGSILNWVISPGFTSLPYTKPGPQPPAGNPIIQTGLSITQGFANMILVLVLVFIGLTTILRLAGYETKKLLITFFVIALLVNFSPVICGLIVDASNLVMRFFLNEIHADAFGEMMDAKTDELYRGFDWEKTFDETVSSAFQMIILSVVLFVLAFAFSLFTFIFIFRYLVIWLLVILSPIAFVCYILPATKKFWSLWWGQFIQWSIIGITCGFFLYLSLALVKYAPTSITTPDTGQGGLFDPILPYFVCIMFLFIGLTFGLQTSAMGGSAITALGSRVTKKIASRAAKTTAWAGRGAWENIRPMISEKLRLREKSESIAKKWMGVPVAKWFMPKRFLNYSQYRPAMDDAEKRLGFLSSLMLGRGIWTGKFKGVEKAAALKILASRGDAQDLFDQGKKRFGIKGTGPASDTALLKNPKAQKVLGRMLEMSLFAGHHNYILRRTPRLGAAAVHAGKTGMPGYIEFPEDVETPKEKRAFLKSIEKLPKKERKKEWEKLEKKGKQKAASEMRSKHIPDSEREEYEDEDVIEKKMEEGREFFDPVAREVKRGISTVRKTVSVVFSKYIDDTLSKTQPQIVENIKKKAKGVKELMEAVERGEEDKIPELTTKQKELGADTDFIWEKHYRPWYRAKHENKEGFFEYIKGPRAKERGWKIGEYLAPEDRYKPLKAKSGVDILGVSWPGAGLAARRPEPPTIAGAGAPSPEHPEPPTIGAGGKAAEEEREQPKTILQKRIKKKI